MSLTTDDLQQIRTIVHEVVREDVEHLLTQKLSLEQKLLELNAELLAAAKQAGITLPR